MAAAAAEPFSIRGFVARVRAVDAAKCYPFGSACGDGEVEGPPPPLPPMDPAPRSRWWAHEFAATRARLSAGAMTGEDAAAGGRSGGLRKGTKRKGSRSSAAADRAKKRRRVLQFRSLLRNKEKTSKPQSTSRLHQHMLHMGLLKKHRGSTVHVGRELALRKKLEEAQDHMPTHENSMNKQSREITAPSNDVQASIFGIKEANFSVNKQGINVSGSTICSTDSGCEVVKHAMGLKDDIFGDLPLLESSQIMFQTRVDELPTVIEESFITNESEADSIPEAVPLKLIHAPDVTAQTPSPLDDLVKIEVIPDDEPTSISHNDAAGCHPSIVGINGLPRDKSISVVESGLSDMQLKFTDGSVLSPQSDLMSKSVYSNPQQGCFGRNTNHSQEINKHGTSSTINPPAMGSRTHASFKSKKSTDTSVAVVALPVPTNHLMSRVSELPSAVSQGVINTRINANDLSLFRSMPAKEFIPTTKPSGIFRSNVFHESRKHVDPCAPLSTENQGSRQSKPPQICNPTNIGMAFMKLPGLERMEISSCNVKTGENMFRNAQPMNTVRYQKQQLQSGMNNVVQAQKKIGLSNSQSGKIIMDCSLDQGNHHPQQPTMRLMGKTVSVCMLSKDHNESTLQKVSPDNATIQGTHPSVSCQLPQKRSFPCQDSVIPRVRLNDSSDFLTRIPNNAVSGQKGTSSGLHNQRLQPINSASSTIKDCSWNFGSQFVRQAELNKASMVGTNSKTRHLERHQPPHLISIPQNQQPYLWTPSSRTSRKDQSFMGPTVNQCSPVAQALIKASMEEKYQKSILLSYNDPSSVPIRQPCQIPEAKLSSAQTISFFDYDRNNSLSRSSSPGLSLSLTPSSTNNSVPTGGPTCRGSLTKTDGRMGAGISDQINNRPAYADNVTQLPAKRLVTDRQDFTFMGSSMINHSPGWSLSDAVGPQILDFSKRRGEDAIQTSRNEKNSAWASSGPVPVADTRSRSGLVAGANTMLNPGQDLSDHSKLLYSTKFSVGNGINSTVL